MTATRGKMRRLSVRGWGGGRIRCESVIAVVLPTSRRLIEHWCFFRWSSKPRALTSSVIPVMRVGTVAIKAQVGSSSITLSFSSKRPGRLLGRAAAGNPIIV